MKNLELKAIYSDLKKAEEISKELGAEFQWERFQRDTFFQVSRGRLKLREINNEIFELIAYFRPNRQLEKWSDYEIVQVSDSEKMKSLLEKSLGILAIVEKHRKLYRFKNARIHLDRVTDLGTFLEFEIVVETPEQESEAPILMNYLKQCFQLEEDQLIQGAYMDLLLRK